MMNSHFHLFFRPFSIDSVAISFFAMVCLDRYDDFIIFFFRAFECEQLSEIICYSLLHGAALAQNEKLISCIVI